MRVSKDRLNPSLDREITRLFFQTVADLRSSEAIGLFLRDVFSPAEMTAITKRLAVAYWLVNKRSYENIRRNLKVSSATIASVDKWRKRGKGVQLALRMIEADKWANKWAERIRGALGVNSKQ